MIILIAIISIILLLVASIKYPPLSLAFFFSAGFLKAILMTKIGLLQNIDLTLICGGFVLIAMAYSFVSNRKQIKDIVSVPVVIYLFLAVFMLFGVLYTSAPNYGFYKSVRFATVGLVAFFAPIVFTFDTRDVKPMIWILFVMGIVYAIGTIVSPHAFSVEVEAGRAGFMGTGALATGTMVGLAVLVGFSSVIMPNTPIFFKIISIALMPLLLKAMLATGSRGPVLALGVCIFVAGIVCRKSASKVWLLAIIVSMLCMISFLFVSSKYERSTERILETFSGKHTVAKTASARTVLFRWVLTNFKRHAILGNGPGAYAVDRGHGDKREYPHNMILELLYEQGLIGAGLICWFYWLVFKRWRQTSKLSSYYQVNMKASQFVHMVGLLFLFAFLQAMKTGDINDNRMMFFCAGLAFATFKSVQVSCFNEQLSPEIAVEDWQQYEPIEDYAETY